METYKLATQQKLRFGCSKGNLSIEQLWDCSIEFLDEYAVLLESEYAESAKKSFLAKRTAKDKIIKLKFDIVLDILNTKVAEQEAAKEAHEAKEHNKKILELIADKKDESLKGKSIKQLEAMLK